MPNLAITNTLTRLLNLQEAGAATGISPWNLRSAVIRGDLPSYRKSARGKIMLNPFDLERYLIQFRTPALAVE